MTAAVLPIVMIIGHVLEERSLLGSREAIRALSRLTEMQARRLRDGTVELVPAAALRPGDLIELRAGDRVPADGIVRAGTASLDMASLTGEAGGGRGTWAHRAAGLDRHQRAAGSGSDADRRRDHARPDHRTDAGRRGGEAAGHPPAEILCWAIPL